MTVRVGLRLPVGQTLLTGFLLGISLGAISGFLAGSFGNAAAMGVSVAGAFVGAILGGLTGVVCAAVAAAVAAIYVRMGSPSLRRLIATTSMSAAIVVLSILLGVFARPYSQVNPWWYAAHFLVVLAAAAIAANLLITTTCPSTAFQKSESGRTHTLRRNTTAPKDDANQSD